MIFWCCVNTKKMVVERKHINFLRVMLEDRNYDTSENEEFFSSFKETDFPETEHYIFTHRENGDLVIVFFLPPMKLNQQILQSDICEKLISEKIYHGLVVMQKPWTTPAKQASEKFIKQGYNLEFFEHTFFNINRSKHRYVPAYYLLPKEEGKILMNKLKTTISDMPVVYNDDIQVRYHGWKDLIGRVVEVHRAQDPITSPHGPEIVYQVIRPAKKKK